MAMNIAITGASGFVGRQLVPRLVAVGYHVLVVGRDLQNLRELFPELDNCSYGDIPHRAAQFDVLIHLAVVNNDTKNALSDYEAVNVDLLLETFEASRTAAISRFVNVTTFHAINGAQSQYAISKRNALRRLEEVGDASLVNLYLPSVYGDEFAGKLSFLNNVPKPLRPSVLVPLAAMVPTVHVDRLADFLTQDLDGAPRDVFLADRQENNVVFRAGKKLVDLGFAFAVLALFGWLLLAIWIFVRLGSPGPGIFAQERVGRGGESFTCYKFRTMKAGTRQAGTHEVEETAVTTVGGFLRKTKLDELPQIFNILRGELSLVGPRPCLPLQTDLLMQRRKHGVLDVLPGITGLSQINGIDMSDPERLAVSDARYVAQRSLLLDIKIIAATFLGQGRGDRTRRRG